jgi:hypothetical protein
VLRREIIYTRTLKYTYTPGSSAAVHIEHTEKDTSEYEIGRYQWAYFHRRKICIYRRVNDHRWRIHPFMRAASHYARDAVLANEYRTYRGM